MVSLFRIEDAIVFLAVFREVVGGIAVEGAGHDDGFRLFAELGGFEDAVEDAVNNECDVLTFAFGGEVSPEHFSAAVECKFEVAELRIFFIGHEFDFRDVARMDEGVCIDVNALAVEGRDFLFERFGARVFDDVVDGDYVIGCCFEDAGVDEVVAFHVFECAKGVA